MRKFGIRPLSRPQVILLGHFWVQRPWIRPSGSSGKRAGDVFVLCSVGDVWHFGWGSGSADPHLWLMDPDPTQDPTPFFSQIFVLNLNCRHIVFSLKNFSILKINFFAKIFCVKILLCKHFFTPLNTFMRKGKDPEPDPYLWLMDSGSPTLVLCFVWCKKFLFHFCSALLLKTQGLFLRIGSRKST